MGKKEIYDIVVELHAATDAAIKVSEDGDATKAVWLPKSQIEYEKNADGTYTVTGPEWLFHNKGLI